MTARNDAPHRRGVDILPTLAAGAATAGASTSLTGVVSGWSWFGYVVVAAILVAATGLALRSLRVHAAFVGLAQVAVLVFLVTGVFTGSGIAGIIPGPAALSELDDLLAAAFEQIRTGYAPVEGTAPILCLVTIALGLVAILVDTLVVTASAPAATGLILLCVYAVPASLSNTMLPWWTFVLGAVAFAGLLAVDGNHKHRHWRTRDAPGLGVSPRAAGTPAVVLSMAMVVGLLAGSTLTAVGTVGRIPGTGSAGQRAIAGGLGVQPFTSLRGLLDQGSNVELFRVRGMADDKRLLRAFTLSDYRPNEGWALPPGPMPPGVPAGGPLPPAPGDDGTGEVREIRIEPINWVDVWLPIYGSPRELRGIGEGWYYDPASGAVFRERRQKPAPYVEFATLEQPTKEQLRATEPGPTVSPAYTELDAVDPRVMDLARRLTANEPTTFDKVQAIWRYFTPSNGFVYDEQTAPAADPNALADFVLNGKRGFCEQYASSMAVMLRSLQIPSRVAVGFTTGYSTSEYRTITSQDAHAWVEVYFGELGWVSFDPTPLADGRGFVPPYLRADDVPSGTSSATSEDEPTSSSTRTNSASRPQAPGAGPNAPGAQQSGFVLASAPAWSGWGALGLALAALAMTVATIVVFRRAQADGRRGQPSARQVAMARLARWLPPATAGAWLVSLLLAGWQVHWTFAIALFVIVLLGLSPSLAREVSRRRRLHAITAGRTTAAQAAWDELIDECTDRGVRTSASDTVRATAQHVAQRHRLDEAGRDDLRRVVGIVERSWYSPTDPEDPEFAAAFDGLRRSLRRNAPMSWRSRVLPRSVFRRGRR